MWYSGKMRLDRSQSVLMEMNVTSEATVLLTTATGVKSMATTPMGWVTAKINAL